MRDGATMIGKDETRENGYLGEGIGRRGLGSWRYVFTSLAVSSVLVFTPFSVECLRVLSLDCPAV